LSAVTFYIALPFIYMVSVLPFYLLYGIADIFYLLLYYVIGYRRKIVLTNLRNAFPDKNEKEINNISKRYYRYLCDLLLESFKTLTITKRSMIKHCSLSSSAQALFDQLAAEKKSIILAMGHQGNWEWAGNSFSICCKQQLYVIYHPLSNKYFNNLIYKMRTRFNTRLIAMKDTYRDMVATKAEVNATAFIADQTPSPQNAYWTNFLNQDTPIFKGTEKISRKMNYPVVYAYIKKIKRGYYEIFAEILTDHPAETTDDFISEQFIRRLEKDIISQPETWLWSHRRWKHKRQSSKHVTGERADISY
jgi:Kdo2-lipid IVA lauroyltransferase/acyltransferase